MATEPHLSSSLAPGLDAESRLAPLGLDRESQRLVVERWAAVQGQLKTLRERLLDVEAGPMDHWTWLVTATQRADEHSLSVEGDLAPNGTAGGASLVRRLGDRFRSGETTPREYVRDCLDRIAQADPNIRSVVAVAPDALERADIAGRSITAGTGGVLAGVPFGIKDVAARAGMPTTAGSFGWPSSPATTTAGAIARLEAAGAVFTAKLSTPELSCGSAVNERLGVTANPHDGGRWSGGSSSGPAAAIAAGFLPLAVGEDTGGSIRLPAAHCGVVGLRPTFGRVPRSGFVPVAWSMDQPGPMAATVEDAAIAMQALAGYEPADAFSLGTEPPEYLALLGRDVAGLRVGVVRNWFLEDLDTAVAERFAGALALLRRLGCQLVDVELPSAAFTNAGLWVIIRSEFAAMLLTRPELLHRTEVETRRRAGVGLLSTAADYVAAQRYRNVAQLEFEAVCRYVDVVITPAAPSTAGLIADGEAWIEINGKRRPWNDSARMTTHFSYIGCPALVVPAGQSAKDGLPVAVQLTGMPDTEPVLLQLGQAIEAAIGQVGGSLK